MIGFNGGLIGAVRDPIGSQSTPGVWTPNEQSLYRGSQGGWPVAPVPGDPFPVAYRSLITNFGSTKYYVDGPSGSDLNAGTTYATAFATIDKAVTTAPSGSMIVVYPGTYNTDFVLDAYSAAVFYDQNKTLTVVCAAGQVKFQRNTSTSVRDLACLITKSGTSLYGAIIERDNGGRTLSYAVGMLRFARGSAYNCVLREVNSNGYFSLIYDNGNGYWKLDSCLVLGSSWTGNYSGGSSADFINSASNNASITIPGNMTNTVVNKTINSDWSVDSSSYGVYAGTYGWYFSTFSYP